MNNGNLKSKTWQQDIPEDYRRELEGKAKKPQTDEEVAGKKEERRASSGNPSTKRRPDYLRLVK